MGVTLLQQSLCRLICVFARVGLGRGAAQRLCKLSHAANAVFCLDGKSLFQCRCHSGGKGAQIEGILGGAVGCRGQRSAGDTAVDRGAQAIDIRPGTDASLCAVLLQRTVADAHHRACGLAVRGCLFQILCRAQIQQHRRPVGAHHDILGLDIPVNDAALVDLFQLLHHRGKQGNTALLTELLTVFVQKAPKIFSLYVVHDDVGSLVLKENIPHLDYVIKVTETGGLSRLAHKSLAAGVQLPGPFAASPEDLAAVRGKTHGSALGIILFDAHPHFQREVPGEIGDAEAAVAEHLADHIALIQDRAAGQGIVGLLRGTGGIVKAAVRAHPARGLQLPHAGVTALKIHGLFSFHAEIKFHFILTYDPLPSQG